MAMSSRIDSIFKKYSSALKGFISKQLSSDSESEDLLHDIFYKFIITDGEEESINDVSSWLYRTTRNLIIDRSRKKREVDMPHFTQNEDGELFDTPISELLSEENDTPETHFMRSIVREELFAAISNLPAEQRTVFELNELEGVPFSEISKATQIPMNTLISRKRYAVLYLRKELAQLYESLL